MPTQAPALVLTPAQQQACNEFTRAILGRLRTDGGVHAETAVSAAARMAGTYLLRSWQLPLDDREPGSALACEQADNDGRELLAALDSALDAQGLDIDRALVPPTPPAIHAPQLRLLQIQLMFGVPYRGTVRTCGLSDREAAFASIGAAAGILKDCAAVLDRHIAYALAVQGCNEAMRTVPIKVPGDDRADPQRRPWYRFW